MPKVLTAQAVIVCPNQGRVAVSASQTKFKIGGQPVLVKGDLDGKSIAGCTVLSTSSSKPCLTAVSMAAGASVKLSVGTTPVLLETASGPTDGQPPVLFTVQSAGQSKLASP